MNLGKQRLKVCKGIELLTARALLAAFQATLLGLASIAGSLTISLANVRSEWARSKLMLKSLPVMGV